MAVVGYVMNEQLCKGEEDKGEEDKGEKDKSDKSLAGVRRTTHASFSLKPIPRFFHNSFRSLPLSLL